MLSKEENERLTRVGPGTPMGTLMRRYWQPFLLSAELPGPNGDPVRVRLFGEDFALWRDENGRLGLFEDFCMHRGASMALARCEGDGLRCIYHGWKFATDGTILETPNYKRDVVRRKLRAPVYPVREAGDIAWVYLGPPDRMPEFPDYPFMRAEPGHRGVTRTILATNWVQAVESHIDASHAGILHEDWDLLGTNVREDQSQLVRGIDLQSDDDAPDLEVEETSFGYFSGAVRDAVQDGKSVKYARVYTFAMPNLCIVPPKSYIWEVPIDDENTFTLVAIHDPVNLVDQEKVRLLQGTPGKHFVDWTDEGTQRYAGTVETNWLQDRDQMRSGESYTGIGAVVAEDFAVIGSMGPTVDRSREHLVPADLAVIRMRRQNLAAARRLSEGIEPHVPDAAETARIVAADGVLAEGQNWRDLVSMDGVRPVGRTEALPR